MFRYFWLSNTQQLYQTMNALHRMLILLIRDLMWPVVIILDGNWKIGAQVKANLCYLICQRHFFRSRAAKNRSFSFRKDLFTPRRAQHVLTYRLIFSTMIWCDQGRKYTILVYIAGSPISMKSSHKYEMYKPSNPTITLYTIS